MRRPQTSRMLNGVANRRSSPKAFSSSSTTLTLPRTAAMPRQRTAELHVSSVSCRVATPAKIARMCSMRPRSAAVHSIAPVLCARFSLKEPQADHAWCLPSMHAARRPLHVCSSCDKLRYSRYGAKYPVTHAHESASALLESGMCVWCWQSVLSIHEADAVVSARHVLHSWAVVF